MKRYFDWKDLGIAYSLANLWFITPWKELIYSTTYHYFDYEPHSFLEYLAVFVNVLFFTFIFFVLIKLSNSFSSLWVKRIFQLIFIGSCILAFCSLSYELMLWLSPKTKSFVSLPLPIIVLFGCLIFSIRQKFELNAIISNLKLVSFFLLPFSLLLIFELFRTRLITDPNILLPQSVEKRDSIKSPSALSKKVVWIIFDELDYATLTTAKQNNIELPDFDRLMNESFVAQNAISSQNMTVRSLPALLTGRPLRDSNPIAANDLLLYPKDNSEPFTLRQSSNIFTEVENLGGESAIVGWYHPYPRIFQERISYGFWSPLAIPKCSGVLQFATCSLNTFIRSFVRVPFANRLFSSLEAFKEEVRDGSRETQIERNCFLTDKADELVSNTKLNLLFFHFSIPHYPKIARIDLHGEETYFNSLEVANDTLKRLRETLEKAGQWDDTVLIISSDHPWRVKKLEDFNYLPEGQKQAALRDTRIPFIVKFAGQKNRVDYMLPFNTIITKELILRIFKNEIKNSEDLALWMNDLRITQPDLINLPMDKTTF